MENKLLKKGLDSYGKELLTELANELRRLNKVASGKLVNSLTYDLKEGINAVGLQVFMEEYASEVDAGRKPGRMPPIQPIKTWAKLKGIPEGAAFPIAKKIGVMGIKPTNFIDKVLSKVNTKLTRRVEDGVALDIEDTIIQEISKEPNIKIK